MSKIWFIVIESKRIAGNPIKVKGKLNNMYITDSNNIKLKFIGIFKDFKFAKEVAKLSDRSIYVWKQGASDAWYRRKY